MLASIPTQSYVAILKYCKLKVCEWGVSVAAGKNRGRPIGFDASYWTCPADALASSASDGATVTASTQPRAQQNR